MRKALLLAIAALLFSINVVNAKEVQVKGYTKKDGTKVPDTQRLSKTKLLTQPLQIPKKSLATPRKTALKLLATRAR